MLEIILWICLIIFICIVLGYLFGIGVVESLVEILLLLFLSGGD